MLSPDVIREHILKLNGHTWALDPDPENGEVWAGTGYGARFELIKPEGQVFGEERDMSSILLSLRGWGKGKERLKNDFISVLGEPKVTVPAKRFRNPLMLLWNIS